MADPIRIPNLPSATSLDKVVATRNDGTGDKVVLVKVQHLAAQLGAGGGIAQATWAELAAITGTFNGQRGQSFEASGTHTDPVTSATVPNGGIFAWSTSPAGWEWIGQDETAVLEASLRYPIREVTEVLLYTRDFTNAAWGKFSATITSSTGVSWDGVSDACLLTENASSAQHYVQQSIGSYGSGTDIVASIIVKPNGRTRFTLNCSQSSTGYAGLFDVSTGWAKEGGLASAAWIEPYDNGWYRLCVRFTTSLTAIVSYALFLASSEGLSLYAGDGTSGAYISEANITIGSTLYPPITAVADPATVRTVVRDPVVNETKTDLAALSSRVDLVEQAADLTTVTVENLLEHSDNFTEPKWTKTGVTTTINSETDSDPNAWTKLSETADTGSHQIQQNLSSFPVGTVITAQIEVKAEQRTRFTLSCVDGAVGRSGIFDLAAGTAKPHLTTVNSVGLEKTGDPGGYLASITFTTTSGAAVLYRFVLNDDSGNSTYLGILGRGMHVRHAQLTVGGEVLPHVVTGAAAGTADISVTQAVDAFESPFLSGATEGFYIGSSLRDFPIFIIDGQSNASGAGDGALVATTALYSGYALAGSDGPWTDGTRITTLVDLIESGTYETACSGWVNTVISGLYAETSQYLRAGAINHAIGGKHYYQLKRGNPSYSNGLARLRDICRIARENGWRPYVAAYNWLGGEADYATTAEDRSNNLVQFYRNIRGDVFKITGQTEDFPFIIDSTRYFSNVANADPFTAEIVRGDRMAAARNPNIILGNPIYQYESNVGEEIHIVNEAQNLRGQALGRVTLAEVYGAGWTPFHERAVYRSGAKQITVEFQGTALGADPIVLDTTGAVITTTGLPPENYYGLVFNDGSGASPKIVSHSINGRKLVLTLEFVPTGFRGRLCYATQRNTGETRDGPVYGARGCLRGTASHASLYAGLPAAYDWCLPFIAEFDLGANRVTADMT